MAKHREYILRQDLQPPLSVVSWAQRLFGDEVSVVATYHILKTQQDQRSFRNLETAHAVVVLHLSSNQTLIGVRMFYQNDTELKNFFVFFSRKGKTFPGLDFLTDHVGHFLVNRLLPKFGGELPISRYVMRHFLPKKIELMEEEKPLCPLSTVGAHEQQRSST